MVREATENDLQEILELYLSLHEKAVPEIVNALLGCHDPALSC